MYLESLEIAEASDRAHEHWHQDVLDRLNVGLVHDVLVLERLGDRQHEALVAERETSHALLLGQLATNALANELAHFIRLVALLAFISSEYNQRVSGIGIGINHTLPSRYINLVTAASVVMSAPGTTPTSLSACCDTRHRQRQMCVRVRAVAAHTMPAA